MEPYIYKVKEVVRVIDGDTVDVLIDLGFSISMKERIRLSVIDTDELRGGTIATKERAKMATARVKELLSIPNSSILIKTEKDKTGKYGRLLGVFLVTTTSGTIDVNQTLMEEGYQKGGTGTDFGKQLVLL